MKKLLYWLLWIVKGKPSPFKTLEENQKAINILLNMALDKQKRTLYPMFNTEDMYYKQFYSALKFRNRFDIKTF